MKKFCILITVLLLLAGCSSGTDETVPEDKPKTDVPANTQADKKNDDEMLKNIKLIKEYVYQDGDYTKHLLILNNENDTQAWVKAESKAYDADDKLIGAGEESTVIGPNAVGIIHQQIKNISDVNKFSNEFKLEDNLVGINEIHSFLSFEPTILSDKVLIEMKYIGDIKPNQVAFNVLLLDENGELIGCEEGYAFDLEPGDEKTIQIDIRETFSDAIVILEGNALGEVKLLEGEKESSSSSSTTIIEDFKEIGSELLDIGTETVSIFTDAFSESFGDIISSFSNKKEEETQHAVTEPEKEEEKVEEKAEIEYISATVDEMYEILHDNALKAKKTYGDQYVEVTGILGTIDSNGNYICLEEMNTAYSFYSVQCFVKNDEQLDHVLEMSSGKKYTIRVKITSVGEILGYSGDIVEFVD